MADNFDNYGMKVRATVDMPSVGDVDKQIRKLEKSISKLQVSGKLDNASLKNLSHQLDTLKATVTTANFSPTALTELTNQVEKALGKVQLSGNLANVGKELGTAISQGVKESIDSSSLIDSQNKLQSELNETDKSVKKVLYHFGELTKLGEQSAKSRTLGKGNSNSNYASLNSLTGLYLTDKKNELLKKTMSSSHNKYTGTDINAIDVSSYNLFIAETDEMAEKIKLFFSQIGELTSQLHRSKDTTEVVPSNLKIEIVYSQMKELFGDVSLTYEQFENFIKNCRNIVSKYNLNDLLNPTNFKGNELPEEIRNMDSFQTQIMKMLGFEGLDLSKTSSYSGTNNVGTVVFDIGKDKIVEVKTYAEAIEELTKVEEKASSSTTNTVIQNEERKQQAIQETLNMEEQSEKIKELAVKKANERKEVNNLRKEIEEETGVKVNVSDVRQAQKEVEKANKAQQEGAKENIKLREQEVAHTRMLAKETKANADLLDAQKKEELVQIKANNKEQIEGLKQERLQIEENAKLSSAISKQKVAETKAEANEQKALQTSLNTPEKEIKRKLDNDVYTTDIDKLEKKFVDYGLTVEQAKEKVSGLRDDLKELDKLSGDELIKKANDWESAFEKVEVQLEQTKLSYKDLEKVNKIQLLSNGGIKNDYATQIAQLEGNFRRLGLSQEEVSQKTSKVSTAFGELKTRVNQPFDESNYQEIINLNDVLQRELIESSNEYTKLQASFKGFATEQQRLSLANTIEAWNQKNTKATREVVDENHKYIMCLRDLSTEMRKVDFDRINTGFKQNENSMRAMNRLGKSLKEQFKQAYESFTMWLSASSLVMKVVSETKQEITELKDVNTLLTEISKANDKLTKEQLTKIADNGFDTASKYGKKVTDYLSGVQEASRAGYKNAEAIAELSVAIQGAGDVTEDVANSYVIATDKAYKLGGSVEALTEVFDGTNKITNENAVNMTGLAEAMTIVGSTAASFGVEVDETTAAIATMSAVTQQSGSEVARAFRAILLNIRQVSDEEEGIDAEGLTKYEKACNALGVSLKETKNGVLETRDAMDVLKELSEEYVKLDENDLRRTELLNSVGGKLRATQLDALLRNFDTYETMLQQYADGTGSMAREAEKTANSWEGSLNRLENTWTDTVENVANSDAIITILNSFNGLLSIINEVTSALGSLGTIGVIGGGILGAKNAGREKCYPSYRICL